MPHTLVAMTDIFPKRYIEFLRLVHEVEPECQHFPDIFFPEEWDDHSGQANKMAKEFCGRCPIQQQCLTYAVENNELYGIWGGMAPRARRNLRKSFR